MESVIQDRVCGCPIRLGALRRAVGAGIVLPIACLLTLAVTSGCGPGGVERAVVSGTVTHNGRPLEQGQIRFVPEAGQKLPSSGAIITEGDYVAGSQGGVPIGKHKIQIESWRPTAKWLKEHGPPGPDAVWDMIPQQQIIPAKYNAKTELSITIEPGSKEIVQDFNLTD